MPCEYTAEYYADPNQSLVLMLLFFFVFRILGPQCIISCLVNEFGVPNTNSPVFNVLLRERLICSSGLNAAEKSKIQKLVEFMGGSFQVTELTQSTSHLVTNTVMSLKYEVYMGEAEGAIFYFFFII